MAADVMLRLADGLELPLTAVTQAFAVVGKRGSGKTSTAVALVEEMLAAVQHVIVFDPTGAWWGLRANADGTPGDLPVVIVGGDHADLPLDPGSGVVLARLLVETRQSAVLDVSEMSKTKQRTFAAEFLEELYRINRDPLHLVIDEADIFAPQRTEPAVLRCLGAVDSVARRGRIRGIGVTLITQRPAVLNKDVMSQAEVLVALQLTSPRDITAVGEWIINNADEADARQLKDTIASLPTGTAWVWSPGWLKILKKVPIRRRRTFDSSATPEPGVRRRTATMGANFDVDALRARLAALVDAGKPGAKAAAPRPAAPVRTVAGDGRSQAQVAPLEARVLSLNAELERLRTAPPQTVTVSVLDDADRGTLAALAEGFAAVANRLTDFLASHAASGPTAPAGRRPATPATPERTAPPRTAVTAPAVPRTSSSPSSPKAGALRMLAAMASYHPVTLTRAQLATVSKMKATGGTYQTYLSQLRTGGYLVEEAGRLSLTDQGMVAAGAAPTEALTAADVRAQWRSALKAGAARMFDVLVDAYPDPISRADLAEAIEMAPGGGTFSTYLSILKSNGLALVEGPDVTASPTLFLEPGQG